MARRIRGMDARSIAKLTRPGAVKRILVRGTNWIGDAVLTTPALMAIRKGFPQAKIALLVKPAIAELLHHHPAVDEIVLYRDPGPHAGLGGKLTLADRKSTRLNSSHGYISYAVFCLKKKNDKITDERV